MIIIGAKLFKTYAPLKVNVSFAVKGVETTSMYHVTDSIMQTIDYKYEVSLRQTEPVKARINAPDTVTKILRKTMSTLSECVQRPLPCEITVPDRVIVMGELGGRSALAAATIRLANTAFDLKLEPNMMQLIGAQISSGIQFAVHGGRARVTGGQYPSIYLEKIPDLYYVACYPHDTKFNQQNHYVIHTNTRRSLIEIACERSPVTERLLKMKTGHEMEHGLVSIGPSVFWSYKRHENAIEMLSRARSIPNVTAIMGRAIPLDPICTE